MSQAIAQQNANPADRFDGDSLPGFVDVLASRGSWPACAYRGSDPYLASRRRLPLHDGPVSVETVTLEGGVSGDALPNGDEFVLVLAGAIRFHQAGRELRLASGEAAVLVRERRVEWSTQGATELIVMRCTAGGGVDSDEPVRIAVDAPLGPSNGPLPELLIGAKPICGNHTDYRSQSGEFVCGTWDSTPYHRQLMTFRHYELMRLLEGQVTFIDQEGRAGTFGPGDVVLFVQGSGCSWESRTHVKKIYATYRPAE